jgi:hypothetical protein
MMGMRNIVTCFDRPTVQPVRPRSNGPYMYSPPIDDPPEEAPHHTADPKKARYGGFSRVLHTRRLVSASG